MAGSVYRHRHELDFSKAKQDPRWSCSELEDGVVLGKGLLAFCFLLGVELTKEITHLTQTMGVSEKEV